jgi:hypothetical protein
VRKARARARALATPALQLPSPPHGQEGRALLASRGREWPLLARGGWAGEGGLAIWPSVLDPPGQDPELDAAAGRMAQAAAHTEAQGLSASVPRCGVAVRAQPPCLPCCPP